MKSYIVTCSAGFRDAVLALAVRKAVTASDLVTAVLVLHEHLDPDSVPDPGDAGPDDRDVILLKSGPRAGRVLRRKPRLQLRLKDGLSDVYIRRALALLLALDAGERALSESDSTGSADNDDTTDPVRDRARGRSEIDDAREHAEEMRALVSLMTFDPLPDGVRTVSDARYVLGLPPGMRLNRRIVKARFRMLSQIYHPDKETGDTLRMTQLIDASRLMEGDLRRREAAE
ncbi:J domain-containing protein [Fodinicurvata sp. EGI_FJ10296]|uniref:J domain-containing protein n=1 Tax=Fodinicurvata sp. EGI_FJ10296 TaxID=3231908 RepID=UPI003455DCBD